MKIKSKHFISTTKTTGIILIEIENINKKDIEQIIITTLQRINLTR